MTQALTDLDALHLTVCKSFQLGGREAERVQKFIRAGEELRSTLDDVGRRTWSKKPSPYEKHR